MKRTIELVPGDRVMVISEPDMQPAVVESVKSWRVEDFLGLPPEEAAEHAGWSIAFTSGLVVDPHNVPGMNADTEWVLADD